MPRCRERRRLIRPISGVRRGEGEPPKEKRKGKKEKRKKKEKKGREKEKKTVKI